MIVDRSDSIVIDEVRVSPEANISTNVQFKLYRTRARAHPWVQTSMTTSEVMPVVILMRASEFRDASTTRGLANTHSCTSTTY